MKKLSFTFLEINKINQELGEIAPSTTPIQQESTQTTKSNVNLSSLLVVSVLIVILATLPLIWLISGFESVRGHSLLAEFIQQQMNSLISYVPDFQGRFNWRHTFLGLYNHSISVRFANNTTYFIPYEFNFYVGMPFLLLLPFMSIFFAYLLTMRLWKRQSSFFVLVFIVSALYALLFTVIAKSSSFIIFDATVLTDIIISYSLATVFIQSFFVSFCFSFISLYFIRRKEKIVHQPSIQLMKFVLTDYAKIAGVGILLIIALAIYASISDPWIDLEFFIGLSITNIFLLIGPLFGGQINMQFTDIQYIYKLFNDTSHLDEYTFFEDLSIEITQLTFFPTIIGGGYILLVLIWKRRGERLIAKTKKQALQYSAYYASLLMLLIAGTIYFSTSGTSLVTPQTVYTAARIDGSLLEPSIHLLPMLLAGTIIFAIVSFYAIYKRF